MTRYTFEGGATDEFLSSLSLSFSLSLSLSLSLSFSFSFTDSFTSLLSLLSLLSVLRPLVVSTVAVAAADVAAGIFFFGSSSIHVDDCFFSIDPILLAMICCNRLVDTHRQTDMKSKGKIHTQM